MPPTTPPAPPASYNHGQPTGPGGGPPNGGLAAPAPVTSAPAAPRDPRYPTGFQPIYNPNDAAITTSQQLNDVYSALQNATNNLQLRDYSATAPQGTAATGSAAQGTASTYNAAQGGPSGYNASLGGASSIGGVAGSAALGNAAYADPTRISTAGDINWQAQQQTLANILARQAAGGGLSPADIQLRHGMEDSVAGNLAVLGSQRGSGNFALAQRSASDDRARAAAVLNQQMGLQRAQETLGAQGMLGNVLGTARGQAQNYNINQADLLQQLRMGNAGLEQGMTLADMNAANAMTGQNMGLAQQANEFNAGNAQNMTLADMSARNAALQYNAGNSQQSMLSNLLARNNQLQFNAGQGQAMTLADLVAQNQFGLTNLENQQQTNVQNLGLAGQYGLANQGAAIQSQGQYDQQLLGLLGAQTGIGQSNRAAMTADDQMRQMAALNQYATDKSVTLAQMQADANMTGALVGGTAALGAAALTAFSDKNVKTGITGGNPMLRSFLEQYQESRGVADPTNAPEAGFGLHVQRYSQALSGGGLTDDDTQAFTGPGESLSDEREKVPVAAKDDVRRGELGVLHRPDGGFSTEYSITVTDPRLNDGKPTNIPTLVKGQKDVYGILSGAPLTEEQNEAAIVRAAARVKAGGYLPSYDDISRADQIAADRSHSIGNAMMSDYAGTLPQTITPDASIRNAGTLFPWPATPNLDSSLSDDNEKEAVMSGNRGLQAFLEQQNAQTGAQNQQGSYNNAFMQTGAPPSAQVDRQMPPFAQPGFNPNANYGAPSLQDLLSSGYGGGGLDTLGGYQAGGFSPGGMTDQGSEWNAGITDAGSVQQGGISGPAGMTSGGVQLPPIPINHNAPIGGMSPVANAGVIGMMPRQLPPLTPGSIGANGSIGASSPLSPLSAPLTGVARPLPAAGTPTFAPGATPGLAAAGFPTTNLGSTGMTPIARSGPSTLAGRLSDEQEKTDISSDPAQMQDFLDRLHAHSYRYKDPSAPGAGEGRYVSPMAQELEQTDLGRNFVFEGPSGAKMINYGKLAGTQLAATAMLNERVNDLESLLRDDAAQRKAA
jgi:hypothetical protein